jgi:hypothetical protein
MFQSSNWKNIKPSILTNGALALIALCILGNVLGMFTPRSVDVMKYFFMAWIDFLICRMERCHLLRMEILVQRTDMKLGSKV